MMNRDHWARPLFSVIVGGITLISIACGNPESFYGEPSDIPSTHLEKKWLGVWRDTTRGIEHDFMIYVEDGKHFKFSWHPDGSFGTVELSESSAKDGRKFQRSDIEPAFGDHYLLLPDGALEVRDDDGLIKRMRAIPRWGVAGA